MKCTQIRRKSRWLANIKLAKYAWPIITPYYQPNKTHTRYATSSTRPNTKHTPFWLDISYINVKLYPNIKSYNLKFEEVPKYTKLYFQTKNCIRQFYYEGTTWIRVMFVMSGDVSKKKKTSTTFIQSTNHSNYTI